MRLQAIDRRAYGDARAREGCLVRVGVSATASTGRAMSDRGRAIWHGGMVEGAKGDASGARRADVEYLSAKRRIVPASTSRMGTSPHLSTAIRCCKIYCWYYCWYFVKHTNRFVINYNTLVDCCGSLKRHHSCTDRHAETHGNPLTVQRRAARVAADYPQLAHNLPTPYPQHGSQVWRGLARPCDVSERFRPSQALQRRIQSIAAELEPC